MAQYKAISNGDILAFDNIDQGLLRRPSIRALALENSSIEDFERRMQDEESYYEDDEEIQALVNKKRKGSFDFDSEKDSAIRSS